MHDIKVMSTLIVLAIRQFKEYRPLFPRSFNIFGVFHLFILPKIIFYIRQLLQNIIARQNTRYRSLLFSTTKRMFIKSSRTIHFQKPPMTHIPGLFTMFQILEASIIITGRTCTPSFSFHLDKIEYVGKSLTMKN